MAYDVQLGVYCAISWTCFVFVVMAYFAVHESSFLTWGPSDASFGGIPINSWSRWTFVILYSALSQVVSSAISGTVSPYVSNVIRDHKTLEKGPYVWNQFVVQVYTVYYWVSSILDVFLWVTLQAQFIAPSLLVDLCLTYYFTHRNLRASSGDYHGF